MLKSSIAHDALSLGVVPLVTIYFRRKYRSYPRLKRSPPVNLMSEKIDGAEDHPIQNTAEAVIRSGMTLRNPLAQAWARNGQSIIRKNKSQGPECGDKQYDIVFFSFLLILAVGCLGIGLWLNNFFFWFSAYQAHFGPGFIM